MYLRNAQISQGFIATGILFTRSFHDFTVLFKILLFKMKTFQARLVDKKKKDRADEIIKIDIKLIESSLSNVLEFKLTTK